MCGIIGIVGDYNNTNDIINGLKSLEYRGYDSCGIAGLVQNKFIEAKSISKINDLEKIIKKNKINTKISIAHTRWATHGKPSLVNTHPFIKNNCAVVHNGIIENFEYLTKKFNIRKNLIKSDTDSEIIALIFDKLLKQNIDPIKIIKQIVKLIKGTYAFAFLVKETKKIYAVKKGSPLVLGISDNFKAISSDILGLPDTTNEVIFLEDEDIVEINHTNYKIINFKNNMIKRNKHIFTPKKNFLIKGKFKHFMQKEIFYQPTSIKDTFFNYLEKKTKKIFLPKSDINFTQIKNIDFIACGTAFHACMIAKYWFEMFSNVNVNVHIASEFRHKKNINKSETIGIFVSQSGETMDTLQCLKYLKKNNIKTISVVNVFNSSIARLSDLIIPTLAGPEIGVASTKAFTSQLMALCMLLLNFQKLDNSINSKNYSDLLNTGNSIKKILHKDSEIKNIAKHLVNKKSIFYIGRGLMYPIALEGALKLKEITYKHCEGYAAGELKHGPLALIEDNIPVIALAPYDNNFLKILSNIQEIKARGGEIITLTDKLGYKKIKKFSHSTFILPDTKSYSAPIIYSIPVQLIAYHLAVFLGTDVDQPRNLAKAVTVE